MSAPPNTRYNHLYGVSYKPGTPYTWYTMAEKYNRDALPHDYAAYRKEAEDTEREEFQRNRPYPFIVYARSKLWDPTLVMARTGTGTGETQMVSYDIVSGGVTFLHPVRKRQTDPSDRAVIFGRATRNDLIIPVPSVSGEHGCFMPPDGDNPLWRIVDRGSSNGTWLNEEQLPPNRPSDIKDSDYVRFGGNLIGWFIYPGRMWHLLHHPDELTKLTDL